MPNEFRSGIESTTPEQKARGSSQVKEISERPLQNRLQNPGLDRKLLLGSSLTLRLCLDNGQVPLCLTAVTVSWIDSVSFSVRFPKLSAEERRRLQEVIWKHVRVSSLDDRRTAFRII